MILIAEDNSVVANYLKAHLRIKGYEVTMVEDGFRAWTVLQKQHGLIRLVVTDVAMPVMSGLELVERMRATASTADIPVIFASGVANPQIVAKAAHFGKVHFLIKPLTMEILLPKICELMPFSLPVLKDKEQIKREFNLDDTQYRKLAGEYLVEVEAAAENLTSGLRNYTIFNEVNALKFLREGTELLGAMKFKVLLDQITKGEDVEVDSLLLELRALADALRARK